MRILFVTPYPLSRIRVRSYTFVAELVKSYDVTVVSLCSSKREWGDVQALQREGMHVIAVKDSLLQKGLRVCGALGRETPLQVAFDAAPALRSTIEELLNDKRFDIVHVESVRALGALPEEVSVPSVWDAVDCMSQLYAYGAVFGATPMVRLVGQSEARRVQAYERKQLQRFKHILVTSERDRQALLELAKDHSHTSDGATAEIIVLPHSVDQQYFRRNTGTRQPAMLIFSGKMSFHANVAAALHLVKKIMPCIWRQKPEVRLVIAGSEPPGVVRRMARDGRITVTGYVDDVRPYIGQAMIAVSPLPYAVGIQNKVLEAMALGTPVVCSSCAVAGLQARVGQDVLVADEPELFADAVLRLLDDHHLWGQLAENGVAYIAEKHSSEGMMDALLAVYNRATRKYSR